MSFLKRGLLAVATIVVLVLGLVVIRWYPWRFMKTATTFQPLDLYLEEYRQNPPEDRAWEMLRGMSESRRYVPQDGTALSDVWPPQRGDELYEEGVAFAKERASELAAIREACGKKVFGYDYPQCTGDLPEFIISMPHLGLSRGVTRLLRMDTRVAMDEGDTDRAVANIHAMFNLSELLWQNPNMIAKLVSVAICAVGTAELSRIAEDGFERLTDSQLQGLLDHLTRLNVQSFELKVEDTRRCFDFHMQRIFADAGDGDGRICADGVTYLMDIGDASDSDRRSIALVTMLMPSKIPKRNEVREEGDALLAAMSDWYALPPWNRPAADFADSVSTAGLRGGIISMCLMPVIADIESLDRTTTATKSVDMRRHAARIAIAAELHRRSEGALPASMEDIRVVLGGDIPVDMFTGEPLKYTVRDGHVVIYSVGNDRDDDGRRGLPGADAYDAARWCPSGSADVVVDADYVLFPQND